MPSLPCTTQVIARVPAKALKPRHGGAGHALALWQGMTSPLTAEALASNPETHDIAAALGVSVADYVATVLSFADPAREPELELDDAPDAATSNAIEAAITEVERELESAQAPGDGFESRRVVLVHF